MAKNIMIWSPSTGDLELTAALLAEIMGEGGSGSLAQTLITTVGNGALTAAALAGGIIARSGPTAAFTDTLDTAANIVAGLGGSFTVGQTFVFQIKNLTTFEQTLAAGAGDTISTTVLIPPLSIASYFGVVGGTAASPTITTTHISTSTLHIPASQSNPQAPALNTVGAATITAADMLAGYTLRGGTQTAIFTDTTDSVANLIAGGTLGTIGSSVEWTYVNNTIFPATLAGASNVTITGDAVVPANSWAKYLITATSATAISVVCVAQGYFPAEGTVTLSSGAGTVTNAAVTAGSNITLTLKTASGTVAAPFVKTITPGTGFTVGGGGSDNSVYNYEIRG